MAFKCLCGHTRGYHENPHRDSLRVGKCTFVNKIGEVSVPCGCPKYHSDKKANERPYFDIFLYKLIIWAFAFTICAIGLTQLDNSLSTGIIGIEIIVGFFASYYFWITKPYDQLFDKEKIEK